MRETSGQTPGANRASHSAAPPALSARSRARARHSSGRSAKADGRAPRGAHAADQRKVPPAEPTPGWKPRPKDRPSGAALGVSGLNRKTANCGPGHETTPGPGSWMLARKYELSSRTVTLGTRSRRMRPPGSQSLERRPCRFAPKKRGFSWVGSSVGSSDKAHRVEFPRRGRPQFQQLGFQDSLIRTHGGRNNFRNGSLDVNGKKTARSV